MNLKSLSPWLVMGLFAAGSTGLWADIVTDEDALFGGASAQAAPVAPAASASDSGVTDLTGQKLASGLEKTYTVGGVTVGGEAYFESVPTWWWYDGASASSLPTTAGFDVSLDARPDDSFRFFTSSQFRYPTGSNPDWSSSVKLYEMFADLNWNHQVYIKAGKQTVKWGVGYYFDPADIISLAPIDPTDPTASREGPLAVKTTVPFGLNNAYLYVVDNQADRSSQLAFAPKLELLLGNTELAVAAYYRPDFAVRPRGMVMASFPVGPVDMYSEGIVSWGSDRTWVTADASGNLSTGKVTDQAYLQGTLGAKWSWTDPTQNWSPSVTAQYYYNGAGYSDESVLTSAANQARLVQLVKSGALASSDLTGAGMHYAALNAGLSDVYLSKISVAALWVANLTDGSGTLTPSVTYAPNDNLSVALKVPTAYGTDNGEYTGWLYGLSGSTSSVKIQRLITPTLDISLYQNAEFKLGIPLGFRSEGGTQQLCAAGFTLTLDLGNKEVF